ncbi:hypothetical protein T265_02272 [Opisthorchis viverrini]|uniref:Reverse transcriptase domain-containing protein n=1 Tax=Opisthorchis viverrini TaxID=6198 RepID=A0A074ZZR2_OPIVI|nr:hypothetical protein T265_02272 [Opisthorchis viverrini]KER31502.1 hypothetical protein T265_02272 [Opisthorchis viverrini]
MTSYHSQFVQASNTVGNMALLPLRTKFRGPAPAMPDLEKDIIDEALYLFKSLIFLRQYEIKSEADRVLVYLVLYTLDCLKKIQKCPNKIVATKELASLALARFDIPGDPGFPRELNSLYAKPKNQSESDTMRNYITQLRQELGSRLVELVYPGDNCPPSKGCPLSPFPFNFVIDEIMRRTLECLQNPGVQIACEENLVYLEYADDIVLMFEEEEKAQVFLDELTKVIPSFGLHFAPTKCKVMLVDVQSLNTPLTIQGEALEVVERFTYLGSCISSDCSVTDEWWTCFSKRRFLDQTLTPPGVL